MKAEESHGDLWLPVVLLVIHVLLLIIGSFVHSATRDEIVHLAAGLYFWDSGKYDKYLGNPPFVGLVATLPVVLIYPELNIKDSGGYLVTTRPATNAKQYLRAILLARLACIPFSLIGAIACYRWACALSGPFAARLALALWCFCPNVLTFGQVVTCDLACTACGILTGYTFWCWLQRFHTRTAIVAGIVMGMAQLTKLIWIIWFGLTPLLWCVWIVTEKQSCKAVWRSASQLVLVLVIAVFVVNLGYCFERTCQPLPRDRYEHAFALGSKLSGYLAKVPVPLPANYLRGVHDVQRLMTASHASYLRGEWKDKGWWYYYLYGIVVKLPLGTLSLIVFTLWHYLDVNIRWRDALVIIVPAGEIVFLVSSLDGMSHHFRYILPAFPFVFVWLAVALQSVCYKSRPRRWFVVVCLAGTIMSGMWQYPHVMSYFNELAGGPHRGHRHLIDSSVDWGQDLLFLKRWLQRHPEVSPLGLAYFGSIDPYLVGVDYVSSF